MSLLKKYCWFESAASQSNLEQIAQEQNVAKFFIKTAGDKVHVMVPTAAQHYFEKHRDGKIFVGNAVAVMGQALLLLEGFLKTRSLIFKNQTHWVFPVIDSETYPMLQIMQEQLLRPTQQQVV